MCGQGSTPRADIGMKTQRNSSSRSRRPNRLPKSSTSTLSLSLYSPQTPIMKRANHAESRWCNWDNTAEVGAASYAEDRRVWRLLLRTLADYTWVLLHTLQFADTDQRLSGPVNKRNKNVGLFEAVSSREPLTSFFPSYSFMCLKSHYGLRNDIYPVKVIFSDVMHPPALSSEMPLGWMPSSPDWTTAETICYPSPPWEEKVSHVSVTQKKLLEN